MKTDIGIGYKFALKRLPYSFEGFFPVKKITKFVFCQYFMLPY